MLLCYSECENEYAQNLVGLTNIRHALWNLLFTQSRKSSDNLPGYPLVLFFVFQTHT